MSSGLFSMMSAGIIKLRPIRPVGHPKIPFSKWDMRLIKLVFGNIEGFVSDGVCGAPIVEAESGGVAGFFHLSDGSFATSAVLDDLVAEGWGLV